MPRRKRSGEWTVLYAELPPALVDWLRLRADRNLRTTTAELRAILEDVQRRDLRARRPEVGGQS